MCSVRPRVLYSQKGPGYGLFLGSALIACAPLWIASRYVPIRHGVRVGTVMAGAGVIAVAMASGRAWRLRGGLWACGVLLVVLCLGDLFSTVAPWFPNAPTGSAEVLAIIARASGVACRASGALLYLNMGANRLVVRAGFAVIGVETMIMFGVSVRLLAAAHHVKWTGGMTAAVVVLLPTLGLFRLLSRILLLAADGDVLSDRVHPAALTLYEPWTQVACVLIVSVAMGVTCPRDGDACVSRFPSGLSCVLALLGGGLVGFGSDFHMPAMGKRGRVLIDDWHSGFWEPAGRLITEERFGDFSAYSFASLTEDLSWRYSVSVNVDQEFTSSMLENFDVVILKTVERPLLKDEVEALKSWVYKGGGLFVIGDHTDLGGMSSYVESLTAAGGIHLRFDAVSPIEGGRGRWDEPVFPEHPISVGLGSMTFLTACSLGLEAPATPVLTLRGCVSERGDYSRNSNFGVLSALPSDVQGSLVVSAAAPVGLGRLLVFGDSTVLSSFCYYQDGHAAFVRRGVAWLNGRGMRGSCYSVAALVGGLLLLAGAALCSWGDRRRPLVASFIVFLAPGLWLGFVGSRSLAGWMLPAHDPFIDVPVVSFVDDLGHAEIPPVIGSVPIDDPSANMSSFVQLPQRLGCEVRFSEADDGIGSDVDMVVCLDYCAVHGDEGFRRNEMRYLRWVQSGGVLMVTGRGDAEVLAGSLLDSSLVHCDPLVLDCQDLTCVVGLYGEGAVMVLSGKGLDVAGLGHCMGYPDDLQYRRLGDVYKLLRHYLHLGADERYRKTYAPRVLGR